MKDAVRTLNRVYVQNSMRRTAFYYQSFPSSDKGAVRTFNLSAIITNPRFRRDMSVLAEDSARRGIRPHGQVPTKPSPTIAILARTMTTRLSPLDPTNVMMTGSTARRFFQSESEYHTVADETLEDVQDAVEGALEDARVEDFEVVLASGVLTMNLHPHGTWVLNKQTPNRQIWWSSPISGPRRYEHENGEWVFTRDDSHSMTLKQAIADEIFQIYQIKLDIE